MERPPCSREWATAEVRRLELLADPEPAQPAAPNVAATQPIRRRRRSRFGDFLERFLEALADSSVQPAGLGPRGVRGRLYCLPRTQSHQHRGKEKEPFDEDDIHD
jgi:hypothetical protein